VSEPSELPPSESEAESETAIQPTEVEVQASRVVGALRQLVPDVSAEPARNYIRLTVPVAQLEPAARILRDSLGYALLSMVTAVDYPDRIEVIYLAFALDHPHGVELRTQLPREELPDCPSLMSVWPGADFQERETYDLMGINFVGHPDLRRILTDDDFPGHPLRKDFSIDPDYVLMRHLRFGVEGQLRPESEPDDPPLPTPPPQGEREQQADPPLREGRDRHAVEGAEPG
jgi:NADH:ubiquinone oxidoreductase subunit C